MRRKRARESRAVVGYARRLRPYHRKFEDDVDNDAEEGNKKEVVVKMQRTVTCTSLDDSVMALVDLIKNSSHVVAHSGAGLSTAAGIPDFRGPQGVWTLERTGQSLPEEETCWNNAVPTRAHMVLAGLFRAGLLHYVVTQNVDSLHLRSGIPRSKLSELHGNLFVEVCNNPVCGKEVVRSYDIGGVGFKNTGRFCDNCKGGSLQDFVLDWDDPLPAGDLKRAEHHANKCALAGGLAICLGTSMQMVPARDLPLFAHRVAIVNMEPTAFDEQMNLVIRAKLDDVLMGVAQRLDIPIPIFERIVRVDVRHSPSTRSRKTTLEVGEHGDMKRCGFLKSVDISFPNSPGLDAASLTEQPFVLRMDATHCGSECVSASVRLNFLPMLTSTPSLESATVLYDFYPNSGKDGCLTTMHTLVKVDYNIF